MTRKILIFVLFLLSINVYAQKSMNRLDSISDFDKFSGLPLYEKYGEVSALKVVYYLKTKELFYLNSKYYKYHYEFCEDKLESNEGMNYFNRVNYTNTPKRQYLLANINYYKSSGKYALEISPADLMPHEYLLTLWDAVSKTTFIGDSLYLLLNSTRLQLLSDSLKTKVPLLNPSDIYRDLNYQAISKYKSFGYLRFINNLKSEVNKINPTDIIVINETPLVLPRVAGIIVNEFQTPLSHLTILGQNRKIPICAYKSAFKDSTLLKLNNKMISIEVLSDTLQIDSVDEIDVPYTRLKKIKLKYDLDVDTVIGVDNLVKKSFKYVGHKACNFGILNKLSKKHEFKVPECAFAIPFYFYDKHIQKSNARHLIDSLLIAKKNIHDTDTLKSILKSIRETIKATPIDSALISSINSRVATTNWTRIRFRSSTNAEDAEGFSGAGLYTSETGILNDAKKTFEKAIKKVWASLWSYEAFSEREYYNIDHKAVYMGVLAHRSFPEEKVNGVAITKNLYRPDDLGFVVNAQLGDESVVKPKPGVVCDQFICFQNDDDEDESGLYMNKGAVDIITQSSLNNNKLVMTEAEIQTLANQLEIIKQYFFEESDTSKWYIDFGLDVEFKLDGEKRELYIKQVRLYND